MNLRYVYNNISSRIATKRVHTYLRLAYKERNEFEIVQLPREWETK